MNVDVPCGLSHRLLLARHARTTRLNKSLPGIGILRITDMNAIMKIIGIYPDPSSDLE